MSILSAIIFAVIWGTAYFDPFQLSVTTIFIICYFLSKNKPYTWIMVALIVYTITFPLYIINTYIDPIDRTFFVPGPGAIFGVVLRIAVIIYLAKGLIAAKKYSEISNSIF